MRTLLRILAMFCIIPCSAENYKAFVNPVTTYNNSNSCITAGFANTYIYKENDNGLYQIGGYLISQDNFNSTDIILIEEKTSFIVNGNEISLSPDCNETIKIFSSTGVLIGILSNKHHNMRLVQGLYVIRNNNFSKKILIK